MASRSVTRLGQLIVGFGIVLLIIVLATLAPGVRAPSAGPAPTTSPHPIVAAAGPSSEAPIVVAQPASLAAPALAPAPAPVLGGRQ